MSVNKSDEDLLKKLECENTSEVYNALVKIRTSYLKNSAKMKRLQRLSIIKTIISFLEHPLLCNVSLSIIANACMDSNLRLDVIKNNGTVPLLRIMKSLANDDIKNRACRALGNIAMSNSGYDAVFKTNPLLHIIHFLSGTVDVNCQQTAVRTLRILGNTTKAREIIVHENGILSIAKLLQSKQKDVLQCSIKALAVLTQNCTISCARQLLECDSIETMVELYSQSNETVQDNILMSLRNLAMQNEIRPTLVKVGAVKLFLNVASCHQFYKKRLATLALCSCLDHLHMWKHNDLDKEDGLSTLFKILCNKEHKSIHLRIIVSLLPLCFESDMLDILLKLDIVQILIDLLRNFTETNKSDHILIEESDRFVESISVDCGMFYQSSDALPLICEDIVGNSSDGFHSDKEDLPTPGLSQDLAELLSNDSTAMSENKTSKISSSAASCESSVEFSINSPSYKGIQNSDVLPSTYSYSSGYSSYCSPGSPYQICSSGSNTTNSGSPDIMYDWNLSSPLSNSSFAGSWSPSSDPDEHPVCWSPILTSQPSSPASIQNDEFDTCDISLSLTTETSDTQQINSDSFNTLDAPSSSKISLCNEVETSESPNNFRKINELPIIHNKLESNINIVSYSMQRAAKKEKSVERSKSLELRSCGILTIPLKVVSLEERELSRKKRKAVESEENEILVTCCESFTSTTCLPKKLKLEEATASTSSEVATKKSEIFGNGHKKREIDHYILLLFSQLSSRLKKNTNSIMASKLCFSVLMDYICMICNPSPRAGKVLLKLVKNRYCFEKLIICGFMKAVEEQMLIPHDVMKCIRCSKLDDVKQSLLLASQLEAESDYGVGTLSHILLTSEKLGQLHAIYAFSRLVTHKSGLKELLICSNGLSNLLNFLSDSDEDVRKCATISLCHLYSNLFKKDHLQYKPAGKHFSFFSSTSKCLYIDFSYDTTFIASGGESVFASRKHLCDNSEYFSALLGGNFAEKDQSVISLPEISTNTLLTIFHFLHGCKEETCDYINQIPFDVLLELMSECDKLLLMNLKNTAEKRLGDFMCFNTVQEIYFHSKKYNSPELTRRVLHFILTSDTVLHGKIITKCIQELINFSPDFHFLDDVRVLFENIFPECKEKPFHQKRLSIS